MFGSAGYAGHEPPTLEAEYAQMKEDIEVLIRAAWRLDGSIPWGFMTEDVFLEARKGNLKYKYHRPDTKLISMYRIKMVEVLKFLGFKRVLSKTYRRKFWKLPTHKNPMLREGYINLFK